MKKSHRAIIESLELRILLTTYYVSPSGNDASAGTSSGAAFATLQRAADLVKPGDVVNALPGTYATGFSVGYNHTQNGTASAPIVFNGVGATITGPNADTADGIDLESASYITVNGFTVTNPSGTITRAGIRAVESSGVVIENSSASGEGEWGIFTAFTDDITITANTTSDCGDHGIYVSNSSQAPIISGNTVFGNVGSAIQINADASEGGSGITAGALIENNVIYDNGSAGGAAINLDGVQSSRIQNNLLYNNQGAGISLFMDTGATGSINNLVVNNTIVMASNARPDVNINTGSTGNIVYNNILFSPSATNGSIAITSDSMAGFVSDYNVVVNEFSTDGANSVFLTLSQWRAQTGQDLHSIVSTPAAVFVNPAANDYHLKAGSPAIDAGTSLPSPNQPPTTDLDGNARPQGANYDIGAYEFAAAAQDTITGTSGNDTIVLTQDADHSHIDWTMGTASGKLLINDPAGLTINGNGGNDIITLNNANGNGNPLPNLIHLNGTFTLNGLSGANPLAGTNLEIGQSTLYVSYATGSSPATLIQQALAAGYNGGTWAGTPTVSTGVITSVPAAAAPTVFGIGYADSADGVVAGQPANTVEIRYTLMGDANLDGVVNLDDALQVTRNWGATGTPSWDSGNFNYDATVGVADATLLQKNWNGTATVTIATGSVAIGSVATGTTATASAEPPLAPLATTPDSPPSETGSSESWDGLAIGRYGHHKQPAKARLLDVDKLKW